MGWRRSTSLGRSMKTLPLTRDETNAFDRSDSHLERSWAEKLLRFAETSHLRACALLLLVGLTALLPGLTKLQPIDPYEPLFAQASKQMLESRDFVVVRFQDKPLFSVPGVFWLQSASVAAAEALGIEDARGKIAAYRISSLIGALAAVFLTYWAALALARRREALLAAGLVAASAVLLLEARLATTNALLLACAVGGMGGLARAYLARGAARLPTSTVLAFWLSTALGLLIAGPVIGLFVGLPALVLCVKERSLRWLETLRLRLGLVIVLVTVGPWLIAILWQGGSEWLSAAALAMLPGLERFDPPGMHLLISLVTLWPAAFFILLAVPFVWINRRTDVVFFLVAFVAPTWLVLEFLPVKRPPSVMPLIPALAILAALGLTRGFAGPHRLWAKLVSVLIVLVPAMLVLGLPLAGRRLGDGLVVLGMPVVIAGAAISLLAWYYFLKGAVVGSAIVSVIAAVALSIGVFGFAQPIFRSLQVSENLAATTRALDCANPQFATLGYRPASLVFLIDGDLRLLDTGAEAARFLDSGDCRLAFVERRFQNEFLQGLDAVSVNPALNTRVSGFSLGEGRRVDIGVYLVR